MAKQREARNIPPVGTFQSTWALVETSNCSSESSNWLKPEECQCHLENKLCLICSKDGHQMATCLVSTKGRAVNLATKEMGEKMEQMPLSDSEEAKNK